MKNINITKEKTNISVEKIETSKIVELKEKAKNIPDSRMKNKKTYKMWDIVVVALLAVLADNNEWEEIRDFGESKINFLKKFLKLTGGIPSAKTYERVISIIDPTILNTIFLEFYKEIVMQNKDQNKDILSFDGKTDNGSSRKASSERESIKPLNVLNVFSDNYGICIEQEMIEDKTNEITAIPKVIERLNLKDVICTWDALNTQKENVKAVIQKKGDYVIALKGNQPVFYREVVEYFNDDALKEIERNNYIKEIEKSHGSVITREYYQTEDIEWFNDKKLWEGLKSIGVIIKTIDNGENKTVERRYYISSLKNEIQLFSTAIRKHWNVENKLHWQLDFTFKCDNNTTQNKKALLNLQLIKKFALNILNKVKEKYSKSLKRIRKDIARNTEKELVDIFKLLRNLEK